MCEHSDLQINFNETTRQSFVHKTSKFFLFVSEITSLHQSKYGTIIYFEDRCNCDGKKISSAKESYKEFHNRNIRILCNGIMAMDYYNHRSCLQE
jgi:hypothetical protein